MVFDIRLVNDNTRKERYEGFYETEEYLQEYLQEHISDYDFQGFTEAQIVNVDTGNITQTFGLNL